MKKAFEIEYKYKKVEIHIIDFVGDVRNINGTPDLFSLSYNSNIQDKGQYILATEAEINIYEDAYFNIDELKTVGETDILIKYFEHDELVWQGFALPDFFQTGITKPRVLRIVATDRIGVLKDIVNTSTGTTPKDIIEECLLQTGLSLPVEIRNKNTYIETTTIERERIEGVSAYDIIRAFMVQFNSKIVQYKNKWWIVNKKLLEDGFLNQEIIDIDLVYLDGQREIKPTASDVSLYLEYGGSRKYPENWNFENWNDVTNTFDGWYNHNVEGSPMVQRKGEYYVDSYVKVPGMDYTWDAVFSDRKLNTPSLWSRNRYFEYTYGDRMDRKPQLRSPFAPVRIEGERAEITLKIDYTTMMRENMHLVFSPIIKILNSNGTTKRWWIIDGKGGLMSGGSKSNPEWSVFNFDNYLRVAPTYVSADNGTPVQDLFETTYNIDKAQLQISEGGYAEIQLAWFGYFEPRSTKLYNWIDVFLHSVEFIFNKSEFTGKGLIFKTKQGGDKFSKVRETETTLFSDKINQGVNGYFYNYKYDDTSITNLPKEYLLEMTRQMADMFCSARDFYSIGGKFKVNPLARYRCGNKYFVLVGGVSHRENSEIDIEEIVSNNTLVRTDYIYTYFEDSKDNIKSIGTASGSGGGSGGTAGGGGMTSEQLEMLTNLADWWKLDEENDAIYSEKSVYSLKGVSALGLGAEGGGGGGDFYRLDKWEDYDSTKAGWVLSALLGVDLNTRTNTNLASIINLNQRVDDLQSGSATNIEISGSGNAITGVSKNGNTLTFAKGSTFSLSTHNHDTLYKPIGYAPSWSEITGKPTTFAPSAHTHTIANVTGLQTALNGKEPSFTKNTAFNKNFGTAVGTVAQGNDSRILNGQTAFEWGNHASAGYALNSALTAHINKVDNPHSVTKAQVGLGNVDNVKQATKSEFDTHTGNTTIHITSTERTNWNDANSKKHTHSNKALLDLITQSNIDVLNLLSVVDGNIKVDTTLWATGGISALGLGEGSSGGVDMLDSWAKYTEAKAEYYVPASLLVPFRNDTLSKLASLESGSATSITTTGSGNAITSLTKSGSVITANKGLTFALASHTHTIAQITGLQGALDLKATQSDIDNAIDAVVIGGRNLFTRGILNSGFNELSSGFVIGESRNPNGFKVTGGNNGELGYVQFDNVIKSNGTYTVSFKMRGSQNSNRKVVVNLAGQISPFLYAPEANVFGDSISYTFTVDDYVNGDNGYLRFQKLGWVYYFFDDIKLEKGTKPTDWTPAPEDQVSDWNESNVTSFRYIKNKPTQLSQFTDNIGVATHIANKANPHAVTKAQVGLSNVDNTSDLLKPISNATQTALNLKANLASPTFTGNVTASTFIGALTGNASSATKLQTARTIAGVSFDGSDDIAIPFANLASKPTTLSGYGITDGALNTLTLTAGNGLTGGGTLEANRTLTLGTPSDITLSSTNSVTATSHTHAITTTTVGLANTIVATDASGRTELKRLTIGLSTFSPDTNGVEMGGNFSVTGSFSTDIELYAGEQIRTPKVDFGNGFTIEPSGTELVFKYNNVIKQRMLSDGTILATGGITALSTE